MRLFVAIDLTPEVRAALAQLVERLRDATQAVRWVNPKGMHLTLKFIGETPEDKLELVRAALATVRTADPVEMRFRGLGFFPHQHQPRVFWVGIEASANLAELAVDIEQKLEKLSVPRESRPFRPHLTLARFPAHARHRRLQESVREYAARELGRQTATEFFLYQSQLSPHGAEYSKLARFEFVRSEAQAQG